MKRQKKIEEDFINGKIWFELCKEMHQKNSKELIGWIPLILNENIDGGYQKISKKMVFFKMLCMVWVGSWGWWVIGGCSLHTYTSPLNYILSFLNQFYIIFNFFYFPFPFLQKKINKRVSNFPSKLGSNCSFILISKLVFFDDQTCPLLFQLTAGSLSFFSFFFLYLLS